MTAREYLYQAKNLDDYINAKLKEISSLRSSVMSLSSMQYDKILVKGGAVHDFTSTIDSILKLERYIESLIDKLTKLRLEIGRQIESLSDNRYKTVLTLHYLCNERFERIAQEMNYSERQVKRLHGYALQEFRKIYEK